MRSWASLCFFLVSVLATSCTSKKLPYGLKVEDTLRVSLLSEPPSLDWSKATDAASAEIIDNIMDGLLEYDFSASEPRLVGALAQEWRSEDENRRWIFVLRKGVKWTDGTELTAQHFLDAWERILNPATAAEYAYALFPIKNARAYSEGKIKDFKQVGASVNKEGHLVVDLEKPLSFFPHLMAHHSSYPLRIDTVKKHGEAWTQPENIQTLGPFRLKVWQHDEAIVLSANGNYHGGAPKVANVFFRVVPKQTTALSLFDTGKIDAINNLPSVMIPELKQRKEYRELGTLGVYGFCFNVEKAPVKNLKVRQAISMAIDRKQITDMLRGGQVPLTSWVPPSMFGYEPEIGLRFDVAEAQRRLDEAGYKDRSKFPKITLAYNTNEDHQRIAANVQAQLKQNLGIDVELKNQEWKVFLSMTRTDPPEIFRYGWIGDYPDPDNFLNLFTSYSDNNRTRWKNSVYDAFIAAGAQSTDQEERRKAYYEAQKILVESQVPVIPIYGYVSQVLVADRVKDYPLNALQRHRYNNVSLR